jgi:quercetin dioxygenase-like cupin family protein
MPFIDIDSVPRLEPLPGFHIRTPHGQNIMLSYVEIDAGATVPTHSHPHEQAGVVLSGRLQLTIGDETRVLETGQMYIAPSGVPHSAAAVGGPVVVVDIFSPIREDYAAMSNAYIPAGETSG